LSRIPYLKKLTLICLALLSFSAFGNTPVSQPEAAIEGPSGIAGLWYDPSLDGEGFNVITTPSGTVVFYYGYTADGFLLWLVSESFTDELAFGETLEITMYEGNGGTWAEPAPSAVALTVWGSLKITFDTCDAGRFDLDGVDGVKTTSQVKLAGIMDAGCANEPLPAPSGMAGLWYDPALDGEGLNIITTGSSTVFFYYGYDPGGQRLWMVSEAHPGLPRIGETIKLVLLRAGGGTFDSPAPSSEALGWNGEMELRFSHCNKADLRMTGGTEIKTSALVQLGKIDQSSCPQKSSSGHHVMLRTVYVTTEWSLFSNTSGWTQAVTLKETENLKYYEAAIWEDTQSVILYAFPNNYQWDFSLRAGVTEEQSIAYREQFMISKVTGLPEDGVARQTALKNAFKGFAEKLVELHPDSNHHLMYHGHGGPGGKLFQGQLSYQDAAELLQSWSQKLGRKLGVVDMGGPCNKGGFSDLENFCRYADYYIASDLENGGYSADEEDFDRANSLIPELQYHYLLAEQPTFKDALTHRIDLVRESYLDARNNMITNKTMQANYLYSCSKFAQWGPQFKSFLSGKPKNYFDVDDLYQYMQSNGASNSLKQGFLNFIEYQADNKDFFVWPESRNGVLMPSN